MNAPIATAGSSTASFLRLTSIEITPKQVEKLPLLKDKLVPGCRVFVALIDAGDLAAQIEAVKQLKATGFQPVPHVPARFVKDEADLRPDLLRAQILEHMGEGFQQGARKHANKLTFYVSRI